MTSLNKQEERLWQILDGVEAFGFELAVRSDDPTFKSKTPTISRTEATQLILKEINLAVIEELKKVDNQAPNFWKTGQNEYTHNDMQKVFDYVLNRISELEHIAKGVE